MVFPDFSLTFLVCSKFPDFSLTGKCLPIFPGFPGFPVRVGTLPVVPLKACWLNCTEMSCYFLHLSAVTDRGEIAESLIPGFPPLLGVGTVDICCEQPTGKGRNVQRLPVPRFHPKQGCQAQIANQIDKGRILQDRRLPLSSPKGQNHLGQPVYCAYLLHPYPDCCKRGE